MARKSKAQKEFDETRDSLVDEYSFTPTGYEEFDNLRKELLTRYATNQRKPVQNAPDYRRQQSGGTSPETQFWDILKTGRSGPQAAAYNARMGLANGSGGKDLRRDNNQGNAMADYEDFISAYIGRTPDPTYEDIAKAFANGTYTPFSSDRGLSDYYAGHQRGQGTSLPLPGTQLPKGEPTAQKEQSFGDKLWERFMESMGTPQIIGTTTSPYELTTDTSYKEPGKDWTQEERDVYEALKLGDQKKADRFAIDTNNSYNRKKSAQEREQAQEWGNEHKAMAWGANTFSGIASMGMGDFLNAGMEKALRGEVTEKEHATPRQLAESASAGASQGLNEKYGTLDERIPVIGGKGLGEVYQLTQSIAQSMALANATGRVGKAGAYMTDAVFFGNSAASAFDDAKQRGATDDQAYLFGALNGLNEALGEHLSIENLITMKDPQSLVELGKNILKQAGIEGSEEAFTTFLNSWAEQFVMKDKSSFYELVNEYTAQGMNESDAKKKAWLSLANDMAFDFVGGAFTGGISGGLQSGYNYATRNMNTAAATQADQKGETAPGSPATEGGKGSVREGNAFRQEHPQMVTSASQAEENIRNIQIQENQEILSEAGGAPNSAVTTAGSANTEAETGSATKAEAFHSPEISIAASGTRQQNSAQSGETKRTGRSQKTAYALSAADGDYRNNNSGQAYLLENREPVNIRKVAAAENGNLTLELDTGETVNGRDVSFGSYGQARLYQAVASMGLDTERANQVLSMQKDSGLKETAFASAIQSAFQKGQRGVEFEKIGRNTTAIDLDEKQRRTIWEMGRASVQAEQPSHAKAAGRSETVASSIPTDDIVLLRQAIANESSLDLSERERNSLNAAKKMLGKYDHAVQQLELAEKEGYVSKDVKKGSSPKRIATMQEGSLRQSLRDSPFLKSVAAKTREYLQSQISDVGTEEAAEAVPQNQEAGEAPIGNTPTEKPTAKATASGSAAAGQKVSKVIETAVNAQVTSEQAAEQIRSKAATGEFSYLTITDAAAQQRAEDTIKRKGWNDSLADWRAGMGKTKFPGKDMVTMGFELYNNAVNAGDTQTAVQVLTDLTGMVHNSAQVVQAVRILKQLSPENRLYAVRRQLDSLQQELNSRYGDKAPQIDMNSTLAENYRNAQSEEEIQAAEEALYRDIASKLPNTFRDKWNSWRYLSMLGNVRTHVRNILGNAAFVPVRATKDLIAYGIEAGTNAVSKDGISRTKGVLLPTSSADRALYRAGLNDYAEAEKLMGDSSSKRGDFISKIEDMRPAFGGDKAVWRVLSKVSEVNGNALSVEDVLFKKITYASAFGGYLKSNGVTAETLKTGKVTDEFLDQARGYAFEEALRATYNDFNDFSNFVSGLGELSRSNNKFAKAAGILVEGTLPFKRTPANIVARAVEYSPIGMVNGVKQALVDVRKGKVSASQAIDSIASGITGTALLGLGALFANMGLVSGGDDDDDKQNSFDKLRGKQSYALNAFDKSYTIDWLAPEVVPMFVGVELYNAVNEEGKLKFKDVLSAIADVSNPLLEMTCLSSLNDVLDSVSYADNKVYSLVSQSAANYILQALPTVFGQLERIGEPEREQTYVTNDSQLPKDWQRTIAKAANKVPGVEYAQIPYIDTYGRRQSSGSVAERAFNNLVNPGYPGSDRSAPWDDELQRLYDLGYSDALPSQASRKIGDKELSADEYVEYATFVGQEKYRLLDQVTQSAFYKGSSDADKEKILKNLYAFVNAKGSKKMVPNRDIAKWTEQAMQLEKIGVSFTDFIHMRMASENEKGNFTKPNCLAYVQKHFPTSKQAEIIKIMELEKTKG